MLVPYFKFTNGMMRQDNQIKVSINSIPIKAGGKNPKELLLRIATSCYSF